MVQHMMYFRIKRLELGNTWEKFIRDHLVGGGTLLISQCRRTWRTTTVADRHLFQMGALGGASPQEFFTGSQRVAEYLLRYGSHRRAWDPPPPDGESAEAEWGYEASIDPEIDRFANDNGYRVRRLVFDEPEDLSPFVAELYRWWYQRRNIVPRRLLIESFIVLEPYWALRTASVPLWMKFNMEPSANLVERYLDSTDPFDEINLMLFSHGVESVGIVPMQRWESIVGRARRHGGTIGVDARRYPLDFGVFTRYNRELQRTIHARHPLPPALSLDDVEKFARECPRDVAGVWR